jgi:hypothetical protein
MGKDHRVTLTRRHAYRTLRNRVATIKTPGGKHVAQYIAKSRKGAICGDCGCTLAGVIIILILFIISEYFLDQTHELCRFQKLQKT